MKKILFVAAAIMAAMTACNKEDANVTPPASESKVWVEFTAGAVTKAALVEGEGKHSVVWEKNDAISVNGETLSTTESGAKVVFAGEVSESFLAAENYSAVYPASAGTGFSEITVKAEQTTTNDTFDDIVAVAYSADRSLQFKHVTSLIRFQVPSGFAVNTVTFSADQPLAGKVSVAMASETATPAITVKEGVKTVTLKCSQGDFTAGKDYYVAVLPGEKTNLTVRFNGYLSKKWASSVTIKQGHVANAKELPAPVESTYKLMGVGNDWTTGKVFYKDIDGFYLLKNVSFTSSTQFKFTTNGTWGRPITFEKGRWAFTYDFPNANDNMTGISGAYDIWVDPTNNAICFVDKDSAKPAFTKQNKLVHILYEGTGNCGLYIQSPSTSVNNYNNSGAWGNFQRVYMKKTPSANQDFCAFPLPSNVVGVSAKFTIRVWGDKNITHTMTIDDDKPFWGNRENGGYYDLESKIDIK